MRLRPAALMPLLALVAAGAVALPASADRSATPPGPALKTTTATFTDGPDGFQVGTAVCPPGQRAVAGGFVGGDGDFAVLNKKAGKRKWQVKGQFSNGAELYAYCSAKLSVEIAQTTTAVTDQVVEPGGDFLTTARATCPRGTRVVSGGWEYDPPAGNSPIYTSAPQNRKTWVVTGVYNPGGDWDLTAYAYCLRGYDATTVSQSAPVSDDLATATATCTDGRLIGGGFHTTPEPDFFNTTGPDTFFLQASRSSRSSWIVSARNYSAADGVITAYARCVQKHH